MNNEMCSFPIYHWNSIKTKTYFQCSVLSRFILPSFLALISRIPYSRTNKKYFLLTRLRQFWVRNWNTISPYWSPMKLKYFLFPRSFLFSNWPEITYEVFIWKWRYSLSQTHLSNDVLKKFKGEFYRNDTSNYLCKEYTINRDSNITDNCCWLWS